MKANLAPIALLSVALSACGKPDSRVAGFGNDLLGNEVAIEALRDPAIPSVVCHMAYFDRSFLDRMRQGNWFENPSNSAVSCQRTGPIDLAGVEMGPKGEEIFSQQASLLFKRLALRRVVDLDNHTILYVAHSRELIEGSAKIAMSSVALTDQEAQAASARRSK
jgi:CreA protein